MSDKEVTSVYIRQLIQLYKEGPTPDRDLTSMIHMENAIDEGLARRNWRGRNQITQKGIDYLKRHNFIE